MSRRSIAIVFGLVLASVTTQSAYGATPGLPISRSASAGQPKLPTGELADHRTRNASTSRNPNGSYTTRVAAGPIHYRDGKGKWQPIDSTLVPTGKPPYSWRNRANAFTASFKGNVAEDYLRIDAGGKTFSMSLEGATAARASVNSSRISYSQPFPGVDLRYDVGAGGVKETLQLRDASVPTHYQFVLTPPDKTLVQVARAADGSWQFFLPPQDDPVFVLASPHAADGPISGAALGDPENNASLNVTRRSGKFVIDLTVDQAWLHSSRRIFPVQLDPTISIQPDSQDAYFHGNVPTDPGFHDSSGYIHVGDSDAHYDWGAIQFDLSSIPVNAKISSASLGLYYEGHCIATTAPCGGTTHTIEAHRMTAAWTPSSQTQQLAYDATVLSNLTMTLDTNFRWLSWDVTATAQNWYSGIQPNYGLLLKRSADVLGASGPALPSNQYTVDSNLGPALNVTYAADAVIVNQPTTLHSNGADLSWTTYSGVTGPFQKYEVHRSAVANFTPSGLTLLTTITDPSVTSFRDTTAAPSGTFYYNVVANTSASNYIKVILPADGQATKVLQPGPEGKDTYNYYLVGSTVCSTYGTSDHMTIGTDTNRISRGFLSYPLNDIPTGATIQNATLALWHYQSLPAADSLHAYRVTRDWAEGSSNSAVGACTGDGVTWYEANGGIAWTSQGGDFASGPSDQSAAVTVAANEAPTWNSFNITSIVQQWVNGSAPDYGVTIKLDNESLVAGNLIRYYAGDFTGSTSLRPKLTLTYTDGSHAIAPTVAVSAPTSGGVVRGSAVVLAASASDDRRVDKVEFYVDGSLVGSSTAAPFSYTWNSSGATNGGHTVTAKAYDDAGNSTLSSGVNFTVANYAAPSVSITAPGNNANITGTSTIAVSASAAGGLSQVELYVDNVRIASLPAGTTSYGWGTPQDPGSGVWTYDGGHSLVAKAYDAYGLVTTSSAVSVNVNNTKGSEYIAAILPTTVLPATVLDASTSSQQYSVTVQVTNSSSQSWSTVALRYRWISPDPSLAGIDGPNINLGSMRKGAQSTQTVTISPPSLSNNVNQAQYQLVFDLYDTSLSTWFANQGNPPSQNPVLVNKALRTALGIERYYNYVTDQVGGTMQHLVNVANGNSLFHWTLFQEPGRGLATVVGLTYNSLEDHSDSPVGNNWSLTMSSLSRFGLPLDIHPNNAEVAGKHWVQFVDGDGTPHRFAGYQDATTGNYYWIEPPGVHLYLRQTAGGWAFTRPDRVTFNYDINGYPTSVVDKNGNTITFTETAVAAVDNPGGGAFQITAVTDAAGQGQSAAPNRVFHITYYTKADAKKPQVRGKVKSITDHLGLEIDFSYYEDGNLLRITQRGGTNADGTALADRSWVFTYTTSDGSGPAIPSAANRINPDPKTPNESTRIYSVRDPRANADTTLPETTYVYNGPTSSLDRWKLASYSDRNGKTTSFAYDNTNLVTTVTPPAPGGVSRVAKYAYDSDGKVVTITNPLQQTTSLSWTTDFSVNKLQEPGTTAPLQYTSNDNGNLTDQIDQLNGTTHLGFTNLAIDANDNSSHWCTSAIAASAPCSPRSIPHASLISTKTNPLGMPGATTYTWQFLYDANNVNITQVKDPLGNSRSFTNNSDGTIASQTDANGNATTYTYDANGLATKIVDALGNTLTRSYNDDGLLQWVQDANHASSSGPDPTQYRTYFYYDSFNRLGKQTTPKYPSFKSPTLVTIDTVFDPNNNAVSQTTPYYNAVDRYVTTYRYDPMDRKTLITNADKSADVNGERTQYAYDDAGRLTQVTLPIGVMSPDANQTHVITYGYDALDRVVSVSKNHVDPTAGLQTLTQVTCFDGAGNATSITEPNAGLTVATTNCSSSTLPNTTYYAYSAAHQLLSVTDADAHTRSNVYDADGNILTSKDANGNTTIFTYDQLDRPTRIDQPFAPSGTTTRYITSMTTYDPAGNRKQEISARAFDAAGGKAPFNNFVTTYQYDKANRVVRIDLPIDATSTNPNFNTPYYVHRGYDANGNTLWSTAPDSSADPTLIPASKKSTFQYYDTGWMFTSQDAAGPKIRYDYTAEGQQAWRVPESSPGVIDAAHSMQWIYFPDGQLKQRTDRGSQSIFYQYDADNVLTLAKNWSGGTNGDQANTTITPDDMDRTSKVQTAAPGGTSDRYSTYSYDRTGNVVNTVQDAMEGATVKPGRNTHYDYDPANWLKDQCTLATTPTPANCNAPTSTSDQRVLNTFTPLGLEQQREVDAANGASWAAKQTSTWNYYLNGKLQQLNIYNGPNDGLRNPVESHSVKYTTNPADVTSTYMNGNRTQDVFTLAAAANTTGAPCTAYPPTCTASYLYDPRDRLVQEINGHGTTTNYNNQVNGVWYPGLDTSGNVSQESISTGTTKQYSYTGNQLQSVTSTVNGVSSTQNYWYTDDGNLWCTTTSAGSRANCPLSAQAIAPSTLVSAYTYDYLSRLSSYRAFSGGTQTDCANYVYDALDRLLTETETHGGTTCNAVTTQFSYLATTKQMTEEQQSSGGTLQTTKDYAYDVYGKRLSETITPSSGAATTYTYGYNVHGSVSILLDASGGVKATYGYRPYGDADTGLTLGDTDPNNPTNAFRYSARRLDSGSKSIDTGARRFSTDTMRFLQPDQLNGAFGNMQLSTDPLSQNRYGLAAGNPLGLSEWDGHLVTADGGGGAAGTPTVNVDVCVRQLNCSSNDFQAMTMEQRMQFITGIQQTYGAQYHFTDWFNAIHGVLRFADGDKELRDNKWFKTVDAPILQSIQDGLSIQVSGKIASKGGSGKAANEWAAFFSYRAFVGSTTGDNGATIERSKQLWGAAEIEGTNAGKALAASKGLTAPEGGTLFTEVTDKWREVMSNGPKRTGGIVGSEAGRLFCGQACGFVGGVAGQETFDRFVDPRYEDQTYQMARVNWEFSKAAEPFVGPVIGAPWSWPPITLWP